MGAYLIIAMALLLALFATVTPGPQDGAQTTVATRRPALSALAANMYETHRAAYRFVTMTQNRNPVPNATYCGTVSTSTKACWDIGLQSALGLVVCSPSGTYDTNGIATTPSCSGAGASYFKTTPGIRVLYDWQIFFQCDYLGSRAHPNKYQCDGSGGTADILVTTAVDAGKVLGYTQQQILNALKGYPITSNSWNFGICNVDNNTFTDAVSGSTITTGSNCLSGQVVIATILL